MRDKILTSEKVTKSKLVSIIVPVYNTSKYLRKCLDSILAQIYEEYEIIIVDDGSTDDSGDICEEYAKKSEKIKCVHKENSGLGYARNTGLEHASGEYITFIDSDDYVTKDYLLHLYDAIESHNVDFCKCGFFYVANDGSLTGSGYSDEVFEGDEAFSSLLPRMLGSSPEKHDYIEMCVCGVFFRRNLIEKYCIRFPSEREYISEDLVFNIEYLKYANGGMTIVAKDYFYRYNAQSLSHCYRSDRWEAYKFFFSAIRSKLICLGLAENALVRQDRMFFVYLRLCISQERKAASGLTVKESRAHIKGICEDDIVSEVMSRYPIKKLGIKQRFFLWLVRHRRAGILYGLANVGVV